MIHTVRIDDTTRNGKRMVKELSKYRKGIEFENPAVTGVVPEGYMTSEEFRNSHTFFLIGSGFSEKMACF